MSIPGCFSSGVMTARLNAVGNRPDDNDAFINDVTNGESRSLQAFNSQVGHVEPRLLVGYLLDVFVYVSFRDRIERRQTNTIIRFVAERS